MNRFLLRSERGFTLLEVMVALVVGVLIVGGVMGVISVSLQYSQRIKEKSEVQPFLDAVAQEILADPQKALDGKLTMAAFPNAPPVEIQLAQVVGSDGEVVKNRAGELYRVMLSCRGQLLEFSLIIPQKMP